MTYKIRAWQAITTKYLPMVGVKGSRCKATAQCGSVTVSWDNALNVEENHAAAAQALATKQGWRGDWHMGAISTGGYCSVCSDIQPAFEVKS